LLYKLVHILSHILLLYWYILFVYHPYIALIIAPYTIDIMLRYCPYIIYILICILHMYFPHITLCNIHILSCILSIFCSIYFSYNTSYINHILLYMLIIYYSMYCIHIHIYVCICMCTYICIHIHIRIHMGGPYFVCSSTIKTLSCRIMDTKHFQYSTNMWNVKTIILVWNI
jgi:hypothetical protein